MRHANGYDESLGRLAMEENFSKKIAFKIDVLNFFSSDIFSLLKLENIFLTINNANCFSGCR